MDSRSVVVVAETPSLARSIAELVRSDLIPVEIVSPEVDPATLREWATTRPLIVVACNGFYCRTGRRWVRGEIPGAHLIIVGARDPMVADIPGLHCLELPLSPPRLLTLVQHLRTLPPNPSPTGPIVPPRGEAPPRGPGPATDASSVPHEPSPEASAIGRLPFEL